MTTPDYLIDSVLVLLVLLQIRERTLTTKTLIRPLLIVGIAVANYLRGVPTAGNNLVLVAILAMVGGAIGLASAQTVIMRGGPDGEVLARAGWASAFFWVLGMGSRFAFIVWITHSHRSSPLGGPRTAHPLKIKPGRRLSLSTRPEPPTPTTTSSERLHHLIRLDSRSFAPRAR